MPARTDLGKHLQSGEPLPVYALVSGEPLLLSEAVAALRGRVLSGAVDFNRDEFRCGQTPIERVIDAAATMPMMAPRRWVLLSDIHRLKAKEQEPLTAYLKAPSPTTVFCLTGTKLDQRTRLGQRLSTLGALFSLEAPRPQALGSWISQRARQRKLSIEADAAQLLADLVGVDLGALDMALGKVSAYAGTDPEITTEHVEAVVAPTKVDQIFKLTDAIGARDLSRATLQLRNALGGGEHALLVLAMIARQLRQLLKVKELKATGLPAPEIARTVGIRPFLVEHLASQARRYDERELCTALAAVARTDVRLKSSRLNPGVILDQLLVEMMTSDGATT